VCIYYVCYIGPVNNLLYTYLCMRESGICSLMDSSAANWNDTKSSSMRRRELGEEEEEEEEEKKEEEDKEEAEEEE